MVGCLAPWSEPKPAAAFLHKELQACCNHLCGGFCVSLIEINTVKPEANNKAASAPVRGLQDCFKHDGSFKPAKTSWHICKATSKRRRALCRPCPEPSVSMEKVRRIPQEDLVILLLKSLR